MEEREVSVFFDCYIKWFPNNWFIKSKCNVKSASTANKNVSLSFAKTTTELPTLPE